MLALINQVEPREVFLEYPGRRCPGCGLKLSYSHQSSGRTIRRLDGLLYLEVQTVQCWNFRCTLFKDILHPPQELSAALPRLRIGNDALVKMGRLRYERRLTRGEIQEVLLREDGFEVSEREVQYAYEWYGQLVSGAVLKDMGLQTQLRKQGGVVLSLDGAEPMKGHEQVWLVRDVLSGRTLRAEALRSTTAADLRKLLRPIREFLAAAEIPVLGVVSDAEKNIRKAVRKEFPSVRHQLCNLHYVQNLAEPLQKLDSKLRSELKKPFTKLRPLEREIQKTAKDRTDFSRQAAAVLRDACKAIQSILKDSGKPPFEPPGLRLFDRLVELRQEVENMARASRHSCVTAMLELLSVADRYKDEAEWLRGYYEDIREVGTVLFADGRTLKDAKRMLRELTKSWREDLNRYKTHGQDQRAQGVLKSWLTTTKTYEPGLFHAFADPRIPKTNNATERVNKQLKTLERRISGSPRPGRRFTRNAPINAVFINMKLTPGEAFIARRRPEELRLAKRLLQARATANGVAQKARRDFKGLLGSLRERWNSAIGGAARTSLVCKRKEGLMSVAAHVPPP